MFHADLSGYDFRSPLLPNPTPTPAQKLEAERLKEKANDLVRRQQYVSAVSVYDEAIHLDATNPFLYGNRALCRLKMKHYLDAASDASDAFKLDPSYIKAHVRYAEATDAMYLVVRSEEGYRTALKLLDKAHLKPAERKLKDEIEHSYDISKQRIVGVEFATEESLSRNWSAAPPWRRALSVTMKMDTSELMGSSAQLLSTAFYKYLEATETVQKICRANYSGPSPINLLSRALMFDNRVWYEWDETWMGKIMKTINWLNLSQRGWFKVEPNQAFRDAVLDRLGDQGWEKVRPSLTSTVQSWIVCGVMGGALAPGEAVKYLDHALEVITWGRSIWVDNGVPAEQYGLLFYPRFLLATHKLHMEALIEIVQAEEDKAKKSKILEDLFNEAESVVELVNNQDRERKSHIIGIKALEDIPCAVAYSAKGLYYKEKATDSQDMVEKAYNAYLKAATLVPKDDESYARYLNAALDIMLTHGAPVKLLLKMADDVREGMRKMYPVWGSGPDNGESMKCNLVRVNTVKGLRARGVVKDEDRYCWSDDSM